MPLRVSREPRPEDTLRSDSSPSLSSSSSSSTLSSSSCGDEGGSEPEQGYVHSTVTFLQQPPAEFVADTFTITVVNVLEDFFRELP